MSYPKGMMDRLRAKGIDFADPTQGGPHNIPSPELPSETEDAVPTQSTIRPANGPKIEVRKPSASKPEVRTAATPEPTRPFEPTPAMPRSPRTRGTKTGAIPFLPPPTASRAETSREPTSPTGPASDSTTSGSIPPDSESEPTAIGNEPAVSPAALNPSDALSDPNPIQRSAPDGHPVPPNRARNSAKQGKAPFWRRWIRRLVLFTVALAAAGGLGLAGVFTYFSGDLPTVAALGEYEPPTVTVVYDSKGRVLGEIYEKRRYVIPLDDMPEHLKNSFLAAEDANFWKHDGIDVGGIFRAVIRNLAKGKKAQGASTITQQVARNFLLTREKTFVRKIREVILAQRVEEAFDKEHILYLYLNQIYLGSGAYGVEAAARTYFDKNVGQLTLAESAILAGLPQRPSDYSPHRHWKKARARQLYVLNQMLRKDFIGQAEFDSAVNELVSITPKKNDFLQQAPFFTEHIRRYLVDTYGFDKIYNDGLSVQTTCDLDLQKAAQEAVISGVNIAGNRRGWRGSYELLAEGQIGPKLEEAEQSLRDTQSKSTLHVGSTEAGAPNPGGYAIVPEQSALVVGDTHKGVVLTVKKDFAVAGVGSHKAIIPLEWSKWAYQIDVERSWKYRSQTSMRNVVQRGDVIDIRIAETDAKNSDATKRFAMSMKGAFVAGELAQDPELQGALFSYRVDTGAVTAMVGGVDFENSEYNRATQARRQVGSTFKPIVYASAIASKQFSAGSMVQDAPTVIGEAGGTMWKPSNYGGEYLGDITLRRALAMSRNVCTVRVLDVIGPDTVYELAGPKLRIGYQEPTCSRTHIPQQVECIGDRTPSPVEGMSWCEHCDASTCPKVRVDERFSGECLDETWDDDGFRWCHSCDVNIRVCDWYKEKNISRSLPCNGARADSDDDVVCRACDLSMGLGSSSLTMVELSRAYSAFATYGDLVEPYFIERVVDRDGTVIEERENDGEWAQAMEPGVASVAHWLLRGVATGGTAAKTNQLGIEVAGKTGTTNSFRDAWFVGYNPEMVTSVWVGFDQPKNMGQTFTGGDTALPIWMDYMKTAAPRGEAPRFRNLEGVVWAPIDETTGKVTEGGRSMPFLPGTLPVAGEGAVGQVTASDLLTSDF